MATAMGQSKLLSNHPTNANHHSHEQRNSRRCCFSPPGDGSTAIKIRPKRLVSVRCSGGLDKYPEGKKQEKETHAHTDELSLEGELQAAILAENYSKAAKLRDKLRALQDDSKAGVLAANTRFYRAFALGDLLMMKNVWALGDHVFCIHPGADRICGHDLVMASWELMLGRDISLPLRIELEDVEVLVKGHLAFITCLEVVRTSGSSWGKQLATNIFEKHHGEWYMCVHHASHISFPS